MRQPKDYTGTPWVNHPYADVFPFMCPITQTNCHSMCICYRDIREGIARTKSNLHYRGDGCTHGRCERFGIHINVNQ